jgi:thioredoxin-like negative regulator of GroEL
MLFRPSLTKFFAIAVAFFTTSALPMHAADQGNMPVSKPLLVMIFDQNCKTWCSQVRPIVADLRKSYSEQVEFAEIDVTQTVLKDAKKQAKELGIGNLLADTVSLVPLVLICGSKRSKDYKEFVGPKTKEVYEEWLKKYLPK